MVELWNVLLWPSQSSDLSPACVSFSEDETEEGSGRGLAAHQKER